MKVGILGGTFNPVHNGHIALGKRFYEHLSLDKLLLIPTNIPPHKDAHALTEGEHRLNMCSLAIEELDGFEVLDIELRRDRVSFTIETIRQLKYLYPDDELYLIMGSDMFLSFLSWRDCEEILRLVTICTGGRYNGDYEKLIEHRKLIPSDNVVVLDIDITEISSTEIRADIENGKAINYLGKRVYDYILQNNLYGYNKPYVYDIPHITSVMKSCLEEKRFNHSLYVTKEAVRLAKIYGADEQKAIVAGLLHDIQKNQTKELMLQRMMSSDIIFDNVFLSHQSLWHSLAGSLYARDELNILNIDILNAIRYHTSARKGMSLLEKVVYIADLTSEDRDYPDVEIMRTEANKSLDDAMKAALRFTIGDLAKNNKLLSKDTVEAYNEYFE